MSAYAPASPAAYQQQSILTAPPERLVVMLYDGALRFFFQAAVAMREGKRLGVEFHIYDEFCCPAGNAVGMVVNQKPYLARQELARRRPSARLARSLASPTVLTGTARR